MVLCSVTIAADVSECQGQAWNAVGCPPTRLGFLEKLTGHVESLSTVFDHDPDGPVTEGDLTLITPKSMLAFLLSPQRKLNEELIHGQ